MPYGDFIFLRYRFLLPGPSTHTSPCQLPDVVGNNLYPEIRAAQRELFLYYSFLNQLVVFAIGFVLFHGLQSPPVRNFLMALPVSGLEATVCLALYVFMLSLAGQGKPLDLARQQIPAHLLMSLSFAAWMAMMLLKTDRLVINGIITAIGRMSVSMYILHFAVLDLLDALLSGVLTSKSSPPGSVACAAILLVLATATTFALPC